MANKKDLWQADTYSQFLAARTRPAFDLLNAIPHNFKPQVVYDLGCGPGNSTALLKNRFPKAKLIGIDSSTDMLTKAQKDHPDIIFQKGNIAEFVVKDKADLVFSNAALQWLPDHEQLFPHLVSQLAKHGVLAIQMPNNFHAASHQATIEILMEHTPWQHLAKTILNTFRYGKLESPFYKASFYYDLLAKADLKNINIWQTCYYQVMPNHMAIYEWSSGTGLRPVLTKMDENDKALFTEKYLEKIKTAYPLQENGQVLFPFTRIFMMGESLN